MRPAKRGAFGGDHRGLIGRFRAQPVIDRDDPQFDAPVARPVVGQGQHRHAVTPARHGKTDGIGKIGAKKLAHGFGKPLLQRRRVCHWQFRPARDVAASCAKGLSGKRDGTSASVTQASVTLPKVASDTPRRHSASGAMALSG